MTAKEIEELLTLAAERPITHVDGVDAFSRHAAEIGASDAIKAVYLEAAGGYLADVRTEEFVEITGRRPTSFSKFVIDHAAFFD